MVVVWDGVEGGELEAGTKAIQVVVKPLVVVADWRRFWRL
jgi:hypothetical protein